ncbi:STM3941 family protein [Bacillus sp. FSL W7-1360]
MNKTQVSKDCMVVYPGKGRMLILSILSVAFLAGLVWAALNRASIEEGAMGITIATAPLIPVITAIGIPLSVICTGYILYRLVKPKPSFRIDKEGIYEDASLASVGLIRWDEIERIGMYSLVGQKTLGIVPRNLEAVLQRQSGLKRALLSMNKKKEIPISIPQGASDVPLESVLEFVEQFIDKEKIG